MHVAMYMDVLLCICVLHMCMNVGVYVCGFLCICMYLCLYVYMGLYIYVDVCVYMYMYKHMYMYVYCKGNTCLL